MNEIANGVLLLIEDNPAHAELIIRGLEDHHIVASIQHMQDGESALQYLHHEGIYADPETNPRPRLILLDLRIPRIDGLSVAKAIKTSPELKHIPVVVLTTSKRAEDVTQAYENCVNSYLVKPVDFDNFSSLIGEIGTYWMNYNQVI